MRISRREFLSGLGGAIAATTFAPKALAFSDAPTGIHYGYTAMTGAKPNARPSMTLRPWVTKVFSSA